MKILSIETSCDDTAISIVDIKGDLAKAKYKILGNKISSQIEIHREFGGVFPMMAKREHAKNIVPLFEKVLKESGIYKEEKKVLFENEKYEKIKTLLDREPELVEHFFKTIPFIKKPKVDCIAVTYGPGLEPALWVGINFAKALSLFWDIPVIPVNHMEGHLLSALLPEKKQEGILQNIAFPAIALLVSGGHTELVLIKKWGKYSVIGTTRDDAAGEAFDKIARMLELPYPGGPEISKLAKIGNINSLITLPRPMLHSDDFDFSFSGLKTAALYLIRDLKKENTFSKDLIPDICKEAEDAIIEVLTKKTIRALKKYKAKTLLLGGGVSANQKLQKTLLSLQKGNSEKNEFSFDLHLPRKDITTDNALMIALAAYFQSQNSKKKTPLAKIVAVGNLRF